MKTRNFILALLPLILVGCGPTRIVTYSPAPAATHYSTTVRSYKTHATTTITQVYSTTEDLSLQLDLQALAALFAQCNSVEEFETLLNNSTYPVSNLDLNGDGYIDYLRVLETIDGYNHVFLVQAVLGDNIFQDVATIVAQAPGQYNYYLEVIGAPYIYGPSYVVRPRFYAKPPIFVHLRMRNYHPWRSAWYWNHFPPHYHHPRPIYLNHYQAYVTTYMHGHPFCHEVMYPQAPHYANYDRMTREFQRNDFGAQHPNRTFTTRNANTPIQGGTGMVKNANDIRLNNEATKTTNTVTNRSAATTGRGTGATSTVTPARGTTSTTNATTTTSGARSSTTTSATRNTSTTQPARSNGTTATRSSSSTTSSATRGSSSSSETVTRSRVTSSGSSTTSVTPTRSSSSTSSATRSSSSSSATRSSSSTATRSSSPSSSTSATRSSSSSSSSTSRGSTGSTSSSPSRGNRR